MSIKTNTELLHDLLKATKPSQVRSLLGAIGDNAELSVDEPFGANGYQWKFFGNRESNMSTINLGSKPGRSLTERVTNAIDGVLEKRMAHAPGRTPTSPMDASKQWFGRPPSTVDNGLFTWKDYSINNYDELIKVIMLPGDEDSTPTIDVVDNGIGIVPSDFSETILSLQQGNKIKKKYLAGTFGQGGSATLSFCDYALILSRHTDHPQTIGFTIVKLIKLGEYYKEDAYVYLAQRDNNGDFSVPSCECDAGLDIYERGKVQPFEAGTLVRHYGYRLHGLENALSPSPGNLYHLFQYMMFDPLLPFRVIDLRKENALKNELIVGSRNRLMKYTLPKAGNDDKDAEDSGTELKHFMPREMISPRSDENPSIGFEYWVVFNRRKTGDRITLRTNSNELFVERNYPILGTLNGQNQGELTARLLKDLNLSMVAKHIVINLDATQASSDVRRNLFSSTREGFKDGDILKELSRVISNILRDDETLKNIERELVEQMLRTGTTEVRNEVKKTITSLLRDAGFQVKEVGETVVAGGSGDVVVAPPRAFRPSQSKQEPLTTLPYPQVTRFEIVFPIDKLTVSQLDNHVVKVETDADFRYDREQKLAIRIEPPKLEVAAKGMLQGGRINWRLRPTDDALPGDTGRVVATLTKPDGSQLTASLPFEVLPPREEKTDVAKGQVPAFNIVEVDPESNYDTFAQIWEVNNSTVVDNIAYKAVRQADGITIYYSNAFSPYKAQLEKLKASPGLAEAFSQNYQVWIGYHAIIQDQQRSGLSGSIEVDNEQIEKIQEHERAVVAEMQVKQAMQMANLQRQALKQSSTD